MFKRKNHIFPQKNEINAVSVSQQTSFIFRKRTKDLYFGIDGVF